MAEKSAAAAQPALSRPPVKAAMIEASLERMEHINATISRRAFELFEQEGRVDGHHLRHWLEAERELLHPVHMRLEETDGEIMVHAELPGFTASDIEVSVEPRRLIITGKRESQVEDKQGDAVYTEQCSDDIFRTLELPAEVNVMKVTATLKDGVLNIQLPKVTATTLAIAEPTAA